MGKTCTNDGKFTVSNRDDWGCVIWAKTGRIRKIKLCKYLGKTFQGRGNVIDYKTTFIQVFLN